MQKAVFLDRDGVLNFDSGFVSDLDNVKILPKVIEGLNKMKTLGFMTIIISNQSGVARKYFDLETMWAVDARIKQLINKDKNLLDYSFYCPHHPEFDKKCNCRKPKIGLIKKAVTKYNLDMNQSFFIGDKVEDIICGKNVDCKTILVPKNLHKFTIINDQNKQPDFIAKDLLEASYWIEKNI